MSSPMSREEAAEPAVLSIPVVKSSPVKSSRDRILLPTNALRPANGRSAFIPAPTVYRPINTSNGNRIASKMTVGLVSCYARSSPRFHYQPSRNPRRVLTKPSLPTRNSGCDNDKSELILCVNDILESENEYPVRRFRVIDLVGQGTFGQVVKCEDLTNRVNVAIKVIKNRPAYYNQAFMEIRILKLLNDQCDPNDEHHIVRLRDNFMCKNHLCLAFEVLSLTLYDVVKLHNHQGIPIAMIRSFISQCLVTIDLLAQHRIIHCDLKPENILLMSPSSSRIKVIDFGSSCFEFQTVYSYIQSRFYRAPEILLGLPYSCAIDIWSLGCIVAELFLGLPLFPGTDEDDQVRRIVSMCGDPPPAMIEQGTNATKYFSDMYELLPRSGGSSEQRQSYPMGTTLQTALRSHPRDVTCPDELVDFLSGLLRIDPTDRWLPSQALQHPFVTGEPFTSPFIPFPPVKPEGHRRQVPFAMRTSAPLMIGREGSGPPIYSYSGHRKGGNCVGSASCVVDRPRDFLVQGQHHQQYPSQHYVPQRHQSLYNAPPSAPFNAHLTSKPDQMTLGQSYQELPMYSGFVRLSAAPGGRKGHQRNTMARRNANALPPNWQSFNPASSPMLSPGSAGMADWDPYFNDLSSGGSTSRLSFDGSTTSRVNPYTPSRQRRSSLTSPNPYVDQYSSPPAAHSFARRDTWH